MKRVVLAIAIAALPAASANAQTPDRAAAAPGGAEKTPPKSPRKSAKDKQMPPSVFDVCKRAAGGIKGPERARFMTKCIKDKKNG